MTDPRHPALARLCDDFTQLERDLAASRARVAEMDGANARLLARVTELESKPALVWATELRERIAALEAERGAILEWAMGEEKRTVAGENDEHREMRP